MLLDPSPRLRHALPLGRVLVLSLHADPASTVGAPENGGVTIYVRELARAFVAEGFAVDVVTRRRSPADPAHEERDGMNILRIDMGPPVPLKNDEIAQYLDEAEYEVRALLERRRYDFVSSHYWLSGVVADRAVAKTRIEHVHTLHSHGIERRRRDFITLQRIEAERALLRSAKIVVLTASHIELFRSRYGAEPEAHVIPGGIDLDRFRPGDRDAALATLGLPLSRRWIGYIGRLAKEKGVDDLLRAFALVQSKRSDAALFVVGGARGRSRIPELTELAHSLGIGGAVHFLGPIGNDLVAPAYQAADVIAVPSHYEAFGLVALEARAAGKPVVASDVGGLRDLVTEKTGGIRVKPSDHAAWAHALHEALDEETTLHRGARALASREDIHSWRRVARAIAAVAVVRAHA